MTAAPKQTYAQYVAQEDKSHERHEFVRGEVLATQGGTPEHSLLSAAIGRELGNALRGRPCLVFESNMRLRNASADFSCYPDASVVCGPVVRAPDDELAIANPVLVIEVLSDSTEAYDRGTKNFEYRAFPSVKEIVFISQKKQAIEVHRRNADGQFVIQDYGVGSTIEFASVGVKIAISELYRDLVQYRAQSAS